jgi:hypothetical protein
VTYRRFTDVHQGPSFVDTAFSAALNVAYRSPPSVSEHPAAHNGALRGHPSAFRGAPNRRSAPLSMTADCPRKRAFKPARARPHVPFVGGNYLDHGRGRDHTPLRFEVPTIAGARFRPFHAS